MHQNVPYPYTHKRYKGPCPAPKQWTYSNWQKSRPPPPPPPNHRWWFVMGCVRVFMRAYVAKIRFVVVSVEARCAVEWSDLAEWQCEGHWLSTLALCPTHLESGYSFPSVMPPLPYSEGIPQGVRCPCPVEEDPLWSREPKERVLIPCIWNFSSSFSNYGSEKYASVHMHDFIRVYGCMYVYMYVWTDICGYGSYFFMYEVTQMRISLCMFVCVLGCHFWGRTSLILVPSRVQYIGPSSTGLLGSHL